PYPRKIVYLTLNAVSNYIRTPTRPDYIAHRDFTPIQTVDDDALVRLARAQRQAAEEAFPPSFRGDAQRRTMVRNCAPENLATPGSMLTHRPGMTSSLGESS